MKNLLLLLTLLMPFGLRAQQEAGQFSLGMRTTTSLFGDNGMAGIGTGGQFRIRAGKHVNTDWFADYITTDIEGKARRTDYHIGWSVLFYPGKEPLMEKKITPFIIAGHCFDYTEVIANRGTFISGDATASRWSSAVQGGAGMHYLLTERFDITLQAQYMLHLGKDIHAHVHEEFGLEVVDIGEGNAGLEGHLLMTLGLNYRIGNLWKGKKS